MKQIVLKIHNQLPVHLPLRLIPGNGFIRARRHAKPLGKLWSVELLFRDFDLTPGT